MTDLFVAGSNGIGFYNFSSIDLQPQLILPGKSFSQIVSSEAVDAQNPATQSKIVAFALSDSQELFYFEGTRPYADNVVKFTSSGYPIASGVQEISTQYNAKYDTSEIMYLGNNVNEVWRLTKPAGGLVWSSSQILVDASNGITTHPAYQTTLSFLEDDGKSIGKDYPVVSLQHHDCNVYYSDHHRSKYRPTPLSTPASTNFPGPSEPKLPLS